MLPADPSLTDRCSPRNRVNDKASGSPNTNSFSRPRTVESMPAWTTKPPPKAALSFVNVDQVGDDSYERLSAYCEAVLKFVRILLEAFPIAPVDTTVAPAVDQCRATGPWWPPSNVFRSPPSGAIPDPEIEGIPYRSGCSSGETG